VSAFEPNPANARLIAYSIEMNELVHVQLHPLALSNMNGYQWCRGAIGSNGGFRETDVAPDLGMSDTVVPVTTLDTSNSVAST